jgi:hypothetical protein
MGVAGARFLRPHPESLTQMQAFEAVIASAAKQSMSSTRRKPDYFVAFLLVLLHHKFRRDVFLPIEAAQQGHRDRDLTSATIKRRRMVAIEFGTWRSGRNGGASGSVTVGNGKFLEPRRGTRS